jgi:hypothetical protein
VTCQFSAIGLFCETVREEKSGQDTIIGIFQDNVQVPQIPGAFPQIAVYIRINLSTKATAKTLASKLIFPNGKEILLGQDDHTISMALTEANTSGAPYAGIKVKAIISPFPVELAGIVKLVTALDGVEHVCGMINIKEVR